MRRRRSVLQLVATTTPSSGGSASPLSSNSVDLQFGCALQLGGAGLELMDPAVKHTSPPHPTPNPARQQADRAMALCLNLDLPCLLVKWHIRWRQPSSSVIISSSALCSLHLLRLLCLQSCVYDDFMHSSIISTLAGRQLRDSSSTLFLLELLDAAGTS